ncbi:hypothetical protein [Paractinoplanes toevensis]|uniref:Uncharacterized protein n=1 Tax=Paractinoplanes toevensis TaxID=571911 RepID=A0A919T796_9ACTN|nr:hypothetical protein [Actinoplanes toevensis]GIM88871.1 hypothetical protein Ato02nite_006640 [Actinoplanes toevensis]
MGRDWSPIAYDHEAIREIVTEVRNGLPVERVKYRKIPHVGELVAWRDRKAWRVTAVFERDQANWDDQTTKVWEREGMPDPATWPGRERAVRLQSATDPKDREPHRAIYPWASNDQWWPLREQYPVCNDCGLIWPCPCDERNDEAVAAMKEFNRLAGIMPGCCWACGDPVTGRHHSIVFAGENLLMPGAGPAVFHTSHSRKAKRGTCRGQAEDYERQWVLAEPGRRVRLRCSGVLYRHLSASECTTGERCVGVEATHPDHAHCTTRSYASWTNGQAVENPRPLTNCGTRGCRGPKAPVDANADSRAA